ncbi:DUF6249 domain-containing protein [Mucilaginibacter terrae]|uniref:DUF6249 domain-containing protein n=1 Tax=Mucilaginibacter terrae TaxID=1955052 RepID=A0ABU3GXA8_9SPHI|nr:DUF6249 domain-containing protein [Mucilaginibacter terrae]MDT3404231.1 hypothetical protein [Mucilaginibacter terrae]
MEKALVVSVATVTITTCLFLTWYFWHRANSKERLFLLEKGLDPKETVDKMPGASLLKVGIIIIGLSIGLLFIYVLDKFVAVHAQLGLPILGISGGISMIIANKAGKVNGK